MTGVATALCAALTIDATGNQVPEWVHLLPAGEARTVDGRGPYRIDDPQALIEASMANGKLVLDENHATDLAAPRGDSAPARGWITTLQSRVDGIWGQVDWTAAGREVVPGYRGISPAIAHRADGTVTAILRASLVNAPNLVGLAALHQKETSRMDFRTVLLELLGLDSDADEAAITAALDKAKKKPADPIEPTDPAVALNAALAPIAQAIGLQASAGADAVLAGVQQLVGGDKDVVALQGQIATLTTNLSNVETDRKRDKAIAFVDGAIGAGRVGVKPSRDEYISMHMENPTRAEKLINGMPVLAPGQTTIVREVSPATALSPALLSQKAGAYQRKLADQGITIDFATACRDVHEGKTA